MARIPRTILPGVPIHVTVRGNDRVRIFYSDQDHLAYRTLLLEMSRAEGCAIHAWVLMPNHVHLFLTPPHASAASRMMQRIGVRFVRYANKVYGRTGTLFEGRFRSFPVTTERYALTCARYIELNPVRAGLVRSPLEYRWSSHRHHACGAADPVVTPHFTYERLAATAAARQAAWIALCQDESLPLQFEQIRKSTRAPHSKVEARVGTEYAHTADRIGNVPARYR
jgi:putative transposase